MTIKKFYIIFLKVFLIIVFSHLKAIADEKIKIGLIVPLSGEYGEIGKSVINATRLALNAINDNRIEILPRDTRSDPNVTLDVSIELFKKHNVKMLAQSLH